MFKRFRRWINRVFRRRRQRLNDLRIRELKKSDPKVRSQESNIIKDLAQTLLSSLSGKRIRLASIKFVLTGSAGGGGKGDVAVATLIVDESGAASQEGKRVAVKRLRLSSETDRRAFLKAFANELRVLDRLSNPHIVELIGFVEDIENGIAWMVFPWEANGNIREFLRTGEWDIPERLSLIKDIATGIAYLHSRQPPIRHGDLKSLNILVNNSFRAVITDFGSARVMEEVNDIEEGAADHHATPINHIGFQDDQPSEVNLSVSDNQLTLTGPSWSLRWAAPELLFSEQLVLASDIWAFGWICWEAVTDKYPFPDSGEGVITLMVIKGQLPSIYDDNQLSQIHQLCCLMIRCWSHDPKERPSAADCQKALELMWRNLTDRKSVV